MIIKYKKHAIYGSGEKSVIDVIFGTNGNGGFAIIGVDRIEQAMK